VKRPFAAAVASLLFVGADPASAQQKWEILDNSFLIEESFNQERGVFQNIFTWTRIRTGAWQGAFTQEWPLPATTHQLSYTVPFASIDGDVGLSDLLINYRYQMFEETGRRPAVAPRFSVILPTGRNEDGFGDGTAGIQLNLPASKQFGNFYLHANAGLTWLPDVGRTPFLGASGVWRTSPTLNLMLEIVGEIDESLTVSPGLRRAWNFGNRQLVGGVALPLTRSDGATQVAVLGYLSFEMPFR